MNRKQMIASSAAVLTCSLAAVAAPAAVASASLPKVTVRIEGKTKTLLAATSVQTRSGSITRGGAPTGVCLASSAQGALNVATRGNWSGSWSASYDEYFVTKILGETESGAKDYWEIFVDNVAASAGACEIKLHSGEQLLFAAVPSTGPALLPLALKLLRRPAAGQPFGVEVLYYNARGKAHPLAGARVTADAISAEPISHPQISVKTNSQGVATLTEPSGLIQLGASKKGYIRAAAISTDVTSTASE
ncbi:MAG: DUF4430 domain-containing protein [Solirubrobacteraceae bacterium]